MTLGRRHILFALFSSGLVLFAFEPIRRLAALSLDWGNSHLSYIPLVPFISATFLHSQRETIFREPRISVLPAAASFAAGFVLYYLGRTNDDLALTIASILAVWFGGFLLAYGSAAFKAGLFPLLFLGLLIPIPERILQSFVRLLQYGSADVVSILFALTGTPSYRASDVVFVLPNLTIAVAEACSGIRSTLGILILTLLAAHMFLRSNWRRTALLLAVIPISLVKNAVRIVALSLLAIHWDMGFMSGRLHNDGGVVFMVLGLFLMYPVLRLLARSEVSDFDIGVRT
jgi:exosortase